MKTKIYDEVKEILTNFPTTRDSDKKLFAKMWYTQGLMEYTSGGTLIMYMRDWFEKGISTETIRRCRQSIQHDFPELRGSEEVQKKRRQIADEKGTHIFRETFDI